MLDTYLYAPPGADSGQMDSGAHPGLLRDLRSRSGDRMRFLFIANDFPNPFQPTKGLFNLYLARALSREHEVRVVSPIPWVEEWTHRLKGKRLDQARSTILDGVEVHYPRYYYPPKVLRHCYGTYYWHSIRATVWRLLDSYLPDAVIGYWVYPDSQVASHVARLVGAPVVAIVGGSDVLLLPRHRRWRQRIVDTLQQADAVLTVSEHLKEAVTGLGVSAEKCHAWSQGVDTTLFAPGDRLEARRRLGIVAEEKALVWVGRMHPVKGLDVLLESCAILRGRGQPFHLYLVGDGPLQKALEAQVGSRRLADAVTFVGPRQHNELPDWYRAANLTLLPSRSEGLPNVLRESLACGTPFVASRVGGIREIAEGSANRLVPPDDATALADAIARGLVEPLSPQAVRSRSLGWVESARSLVRILQPLVAASQTPDAPWWSSYKPDPIDPDKQVSPWRWRQLLRRGMAAVFPRSRFFVRGLPGSNFVHLTFDDGPHPEYTPRLLETLRRYGVTASFFVVGRMAERYPHLIRRMAAEGHVIGNHSFLHAHLHHMSAGEMFRGVLRTQRLLTRLTGQAPTLYRPPRGKIGARHLLGLWRHGLTVALWNVDARDYACRSAAELQAWFRQRPLKGGDIVLFHDRVAVAAAALPELIQSARDRGLTFVPLTAWTRPAARGQRLPA